MRTTRLEPSSWRVREVVVVTGTEKQGDQECRAEDGLATASELSFQCRVSRFVDFIRSASAHP